MKYVLHGLLRRLAEYEYILLDCPPSLGLLTVNALTAADSVLIPLQCEYYALEGLRSLLETIDLLRARLNPDLVIEGLLLTMFDQRNRLSRQVEEEVRQFFSDQVFHTVIPAQCAARREPESWTAHYPVRSVVPGRAELRGLGPGNPHTDGDARRRPGCF